MKKISIILGLFFFAFHAIAQVGIIKGNVKDSKTGEAIIGASVVIQGTATGSATDVNGNFSISKVATGNYTLVVSYVSYKNLTIPDVVVQANKSTVINTSLEESISELGVVEITATRDKSTEMALITEIRQAEQVAVGISAQQITKSQDRDAAQVIRRIPGVSIIDDRFVMVRGLSERYNTVLLNDVITPSLEVDVKSFSFDIIPSNAIDRLLIYKSGSAELPGEFAGGVIKIYTKNVPDRNSFTFGFSSSYRDGTTNQNVTSYKGGKTDWLGFDDGTRGLPSNFPKMKQINAGTPNDALIEKYKALNPYFSLDKFKAAPDLRANLGFTRKFNIGNLAVSNITAINYSNTKQFINSSSYRYLAYNESNKRSDTSQIFKDNVYTNTVRLGILNNWAVVLSPNHRIEFRNLFNQMGSCETILRSGANVENGIDINNYSFRYESRSIYMGQLSGTHDLTDNTSVKWTGGLSYTFREEPDYRRFSSNRPREATDVPYRIDVPVNSNASLTQAARFYSELTETTGQLGGNIEHKLNINGSEDEEDVAKVRAGFYVEQKAREFSARWLGYVNPKNSDKNNQSPDQFFDPNNINNTDGFYYSEGTNFDDKYSAANFLGAAYVGTYLPLTSKFNLSAGFRGEFNRQQVNSRFRGSGNKVNVDNPIFRPLPSVNLAYKFSKTSLIRLAYSMTVNRPEFRELAPFTYYNFALDIGYVGNPKLKTPNIHNVDLRWELYPGENQAITFGAFYKKFINPIESKIRYAGSGVSYTYDNADYATSAGVEVELKKSLFIPEFSILLNASIIKSNVELGDKFAGQDKNRPMMGQSPYMVNAGLYYNNSEANLQINALYNVVGKRIFIVGDQLNGTIYEMPRNVIDLNFTKGIGQNIEIKGGVQDLLNQTFRLTQDNNRDSKVTNKDETYQAYKRGTTVSLGVNFKF